MSVIERCSTRSEAVYSDDKQHRFILRKEWCKEKKKATIVMIQPNTKSDVEMDLTTFNVINNLYRLDYGSVDIVNLFSLICPKINKRQSLENLVREENDGYILRACTKSDTVIMAFGSIEQSSKMVADRVTQLIESLEPFRDKMHIICDPFTNVPRHPLAPCIKRQWRLVKLHTDIK